MLIIYDPGGSGTFYYLAAAINQNGEYHGIPAVLIGDRITAHNVAIRNGVISFNYADRRPEEPMSTPPSVDTSLQLTFTDGKLTPLNPGAIQELVLEGWVTIGHEVRSFVPCSNNRDHWLLVNSPALDQITTAYFKKPAAGTRGVLVFKKDNPTDRPELDDSLELPVYF